MFVGKPKLDGPISNDSRKHPRRRTRERKEIPEEAGRSGIEECKNDSNDEAETKEDDTKPEVVPVQGLVNWELNDTRTSRRIKKKPDWLGENVMVAKLEETSSIEDASLPSVYEMKKP